MVNNSVDALFFFLPFYILSLVFIQPKQAGVVYQVFWVFQLKRVLIGLKFPELTTWWNLPAILPPFSLHSRSLNCQIQHFPLIYRRSVCEWYNIWLLSGNQYLISQNLWPWNLQLYTTAERKNASQKLMIILPFNPGMIHTRRHGKIIEQHICQ